MSFLQHYTVYPIIVVTVFSEIMEKYIYQDKFFAWCYILLENWYSLWYKKVLLTLFKQIMYSFKVQCLNFSVYSMIDCLLNQQPLQTLLNLRFELNTITNIRVSTILEQSLRKNKFHPLFGRRHIDFSDIVSKNYISFWLFTVTKFQFNRIWVSSWNVDCKFYRIYFDQNWRAFDFLKPTKWHC